MDIENVQFATKEGIKMYNPKDNSYTTNIMDSIGDNNLYHLDNTYYIRYHSQKALYAINKIKEKKDLSDLEKASFYYHIHVDMLFNAIGMINDRFVLKEKKYGEEFKNNIIRNQREYEFNDNNYPLLSDKSFRNFIEHIDERGEKLIKYKKYYGTFNFVHPDMDTNLIDGLLNISKPQNNLLNLLDYSYNIIDIVDNKPVEKKISILELEKEIRIINFHSNKIWSYITNIAFKNTDF